MILGSGIGGLWTIADTALELEAKGPRRVSPFFISSALISLISGQVSIRYGFKGPNHAVVTACATGAHAIGDAARLIKYGDADVMLAGGAEAAINPASGSAASAPCSRLSTAFNDEPQSASRPCDKGRDGFVWSEGAGVLVLEALPARQEARRQDLRRGDRLRPVGRRLPHHHPVRGRRRRLPRHAGRPWKDANLDASEIDYVNAHGTSTPWPASIEQTHAINRMLGDARAKKRR